MYYFFDFFCLRALAFGVPRTEFAECIKCFAPRVGGCDRLGVAEKNIGSGSRFLVVSFIFKNI